MIIRMFLGFIGTIIFVFICINSDYTMYFLIYFPWILASFLDISWLFVGLEKMKPVVLKNFIAKLSSVILNNSYFSLKHVPTA